MPRFLNAAVLRRFRTELTAAWLIRLIRQRNWWLAAVLRRFICGGCGGSRKPAENKDAAVLRRLRWLNPHTPYTPLARFRGAQGAVPEGRPLGWPASSSGAKAASSFLRLAPLSLETTR
jgi:hypothetical protein